MMIRLFGLALLAVCAVALGHLRQIVEVIPSGSPPSALGLLVSMVVVATGITGGNLLVVGPSLFNPSDRV
jgi:hypothetical protein